MLFRSAGAALQVGDVAGLIGELQRLLGDPVALSKMRQQCAGFVERNRGATDKSLQIIMALISLNRDRPESENQ